MPRPAPVSSALSTAKVWPSLLESSLLLLVYLTFSQTYRCATLSVTALAGLLRTVGAAPGEENAL